MKTTTLISRLLSAGIVFIAFMTMTSGAIAQTASVSISDQSADPGQSVQFVITADQPLSDVGAFALAIQYNPSVLAIQTVDSALAQPVFHADTSTGMLRIVMIDVEGISSEAQATLAVINAQVSSSAAPGTKHSLTIMPDQNGMFEWLLTLPPLPARSVSYSPQAGSLQVTGNRAPTLSVSPSSALIGVGQTATFTITATVPDMDTITLSDSPSGAGSFTSLMQVGGNLTANYEVTGTQNNLGSNTISIILSDNGNPPAQSESANIQVTVETLRYDEIIHAQGVGGRTHVVYRNMAPNRDSNNNGQSDPFDLTAFIASYNAIPNAFEERIGGGTGRAVHLAKGDIDGDGSDELLTTFGPIVAEPEPNSANIFIVREATGTVPLPPFGAVFPTDPASDARILYPTGELRAAIGNFAGLPREQIAFSQGVGSTGALRILQWNGQTDLSQGETAYDIIAQLANQDALDPDSGWIMSDGLVASNNGQGYSLAAADLDGDSLDELIVGQHGPQGIIQILDMGAPNPSVNNIILDASYSPEIDVFSGLEQFFGSFRGDRGVNIVAVDLNGDSETELVVTGRGDTAQNASIKNWILILRPLITNGQVTGLAALPGGLLNAFSAPAGANPSNGINIGAGEFSGFASDGQELIAGTTAIVDYAGMTPIISLAPPESSYVTLKINFSDDGTISGATNLVIPGRAQGFRAFLGAFESDSREASVIGFDADN